MIALVETTLNMKGEVISKKVLTDNVISENEYMNQIQCALFGKSIEAAAKEIMANMKLKAGKGA